MLALGLDYSPNSDELAITVAAFLEIMVKRGLTDRDADRLEEALILCAEELDRWPTPNQVLKRLPAKALEHKDSCRQCGSTEGLHACGAGDRKYYLCSTHLPMPKNEITEKFNKTMETLQGKAR